MSFFNRKEHQAAVAPAAQGRPRDQFSVPGLDEAAAGQGWRPLGEAPFSNAANEYAHEVSRWMYGAGRGTTSQNPGLQVGHTTYRNAYGGDLAGRHFIVANAWTSVRELRAVSVCALGLPAIMPSLWIDFRLHYGLFGIIHAVTELASSDSEFDQRYSVRGADAAYARELLDAGLPSLVMTRDDWCFQSMTGELTCVCRTPFGSLDDIRTRLAEVSAVASAIASPQAQHYGQQLPALPGGYTFDPSNPRAFRDAIHAMSPEQLAEMAAQARPQRPDRRRGRR